MKCKHNNSMMNLNLYNKTTKKLKIKNKILQLEATLNQKQVTKLNHS